MNTQMKERIKRAFIYAGTVIVLVAASILFAQPSLAKEIDQAKLKKMFEGCADNSFKNQFGNKYNDYLIPSPIRKINQPRGYKNVRKLVWVAYARMGLGEIRIEGGNVKVLKSIFKGAPTKTFRHKFCNGLIEAMNSEEKLSANFVIHSTGHSQLDTPSNIYGKKRNRIIRETLEQRDARAEVKARIINTGILPIPKLITKN